MTQLPKHLTWGQLLCVLKQLNYLPHKNKPGAARDFVNLQADPPVVTFHQPHGNDTIPRGTMNLYISKLKTTKEKFAELLKNC